MLYSQYPVARARQIIADALGVLTTIVVITIGLAVTAAIRTLGQFGRDLESAGEGFQEGLGEAAENLGDRLGGYPDERQCGRRDARRADHGHRS